MCAEATPMQREYRSENKDLPGVFLPATAARQLCRQPHHQKLAASSGCPYLSTEGELSSLSPPGCLPSPTTPQHTLPPPWPEASPPRAWHRGLLSPASQVSTSPTQGLVPWAAPYQTELTSSPISFFTLSTSVAELRSSPHSFILISNRLCFGFVFICLSVTHTGRYRVKPSLLEAFWQVNLT